MPLVQMHALLAFVCEALLAALLGLDVDEESWSRMVRAFTKLLWLQNDLTACHYAWGVLDNQMAFAS